ncbi:hypothetical protein MFS40622_1047 [Methanocaldococcus sp. FS406-22]|nr:hypothetical protein MFS40622_1047 [Methanocaldococcus sp. FS406-22]
MFRKVGPIPSVLVSALNRLGKNYKLENWENNFFLKKENGYCLFKFKKITTKN